MDARNDSADDLTRFAMNSNSPPTLVDLSEAPNHEVDVIAPPSALEHMLQPMLPPPVAEKDSATNDYLEQISNDNDIWSVIGGERTQELCTPKGKRPELTSTIHSQHTREPSLGSIFGETSRQLPPLPASPDPIPTSTQGSTLHNPFLDPESPTLPPILPGPSYGNELNICSNTGPSRWQLQAAAQPDSSLQARMNPVPRTTWTDSNRISSDSRNDTYDSQWAKHMEERSQRIQAQQRTERESGPSTPWNGRPILGPRPNPNTPSSSSRTPPARTGSSRRFPPASSSREPEPNLEPWRCRIQDQRYSHPNQRPDIQSRNAALDTISNILFNFDCPTEEAAVLLEDVCATANEVGVSTVELLAQTVTIGNFDLGMTALCLEASRCDLGGSLDGV
ncbi:hypothetical protein FRC12_013541 [Ceratobasidium sp. 428]|nr:hypothetical protein FRC12_013541 [Ceratobasidium sp. 428]